MRYVGIDLGKTMIAVVARDEVGEIVEEVIVKTQREVLERVRPGDAVVIEWTGGKARPLLESLLHRGVHQLYIYRGNLRADRQHLGYQRKGDYQDAATLAYAVWASLTGKARFRANALLDYVRLREVYDLRQVYARAEQLGKEKVRLQNRLQAYLEKGAGCAELQALIKVMEREAEQAYQELRLRVEEHPDTARLIGVLRRLFPSSERAIYALAVHIAPLERFASESALKRYLDLLPTSGMSGGKVVERKRWRGGNRWGRVALYRLLYAQLRTGTEGRGRGRWRDYYDRLRSRGMSHGKAMIRLMCRLVEIIWRRYHEGVGEAEPEPSERKRKQAQLQQAVLELVAQGLSDYQACKALGIHVSTVSRWKQRDERFLERYIRARVQAQSEVDDARADGAGL